LIKAVDALVTSELLIIISWSFVFYEEVNEFSSVRIAISLAKGLWFYILSFVD